MTSLFRLLLLFALLPFLVVGAAAQKSEAAFLLGGIRTTGTDIAQVGTGSNRLRIQPGVTFEAAYARRLTGNDVAALQFELPFVATPSTDVTSGSANVPGNYASLFLTPGIRLRLAPEARLSPFFAVGGGYARLTASNHLANGSPNNVNNVKNTGALQFGAGIDIRIAKIFFPISLRAEARDFHTPLPQLNVQTLGTRQHNLVIAGGIALRF